MSALTITAIVLGGLVGLGVVAVGATLVRFKIMVGRSIPGVRMKGWPANDMVRALWLSPRIKIMLGRFTALASAVP